MRRGSAAICWHCTRAFSAFGIAFATDRAQGTVRIPGHVNNDSGVM
jgi:hypothetical protein